MRLRRPLRAIARAVLDRDRGDQVELVPGGEVGCSLGERDLGRHNPLGAERLDNVDGLGGLGAGIERDSTRAANIKGSEPGA
jgi:hypothetical protein